MKVKELIQKLNELSEEDKEKEIHIYNMDTDESEIKDVKVYKTYVMVYPFE